MMYADNYLSIFVSQLEVVVYLCLKVQWYENGSLMLL